MYWGGRPNGQHHQAIRNRKDAIEDAARYVCMARRIEGAGISDTNAHHVRSILTMPRASQVARYGVELTPRTRVLVARLPPLTMARILWRVRRGSLLP
jgi:hypothetical protein